MLTFEKLTKVYSKGTEPAIRDVSFGVDDGEIVGFVGLNGAGKTTTIRIGAGLSIPTEGRCTVDGLDIVKRKVEASRLIGWVPEQPNFEQNATALELMKYYAGYYGIAGSKAGQISMELLKQVGLEGMERRKASSYSQGMKKRFLLAASKLADPRNYLFDEVLSELDPEGIHYFRSLMSSLRQSKKAVLLSSHMLSEIEGLSDKVVFIHKGRILRIVTRHDLQSMGGGHLVLKLGVVDERALEYLKSLGSIQVEDNRVVLTGFKGDISEVNTNLVKMGCSVEEISQRNPSLEEYFLKLVGRTG